MFSRKKQSKMAVFKDSNNNAVEERSTTFLLPLFIRNEKIVFSLSYGQFLDIYQVPMLCWPVLFIFKIRKFRSFKTKNFSSFQPNDLYSYVKTSFKKVFR